MENVKVAKETERQEAYRILYSMSPLPLVFIFLQVLWYNEHTVSRHTGKQWYSHTAMIRR
ncbi:hypothetical protein DWX08_08920 [Ruminococcus sp. AF18-22]|nr:hypothetical protein DWX08_08920 [Ruminococcus sp. AF18-22]